MSEIKGQLLGVILVLMVFAAVGAGAKAIVSTLTSGVSAEVTEIIDNGTNFA